MLWCTYIECTRNDEVGKQMCSFVRHGKEIQADVYGAASIELWKTFKEKIFNLLQGVKRGYVCGNAGNCLRNT